MVKDGWDRQRIITEAESAIAAESPLTMRRLHYMMVSRGMPNTTNHYKRVIAAMTDARWNRIVDFSEFVDHERNTIGETPYEETDVHEKAGAAIDQVHAWMRSYSKNTWENQPSYVEVWIEKKALQGVFQSITDNRDVLLFPCKGYPSLTALDDAAQRFEKAETAGKNCVIIYFGDYDPSGEDIPRNIQDTLNRMNITVDVDRILLLEDQVRAWGLPPAPTKSTDSRTRAWDGIGQVELDAVNTNTIKNMCDTAIDKYFDKELHNELIKQENEERSIFRKIVREKITDEMEG